MATRRIARGRAGSPVPIIILSVFVVGLLASTIVLGLSVGDVEKKLVAAEKKYQDLDKKRSDEQTEFRTYEKLAGLNLGSMQREFFELKDELEKKAPLPAYAGVEAEGAKVFTDFSMLLKGYADRCAGLERAVTHLEGELKKARDERDAAIAAGDETAKTKDQQIKLGETALADLRNKLAEAEKARDTARETLTAEVEALKAEKAKLTNERDTATKDTQVERDKHEKTKEKLADLERAGKRKKPLVEGTGPEPADGKILTVDADGKNVMVDIGRKDWVEVGMFFTVFEKGDVDQRKPKGQVQIRQVYDEISRAKVIKQDEVDPILPGMILVNPAFQRHTKLEFRLIGRFLDARIEQILGRYPCTLAAKASQTTDYVIIGDAKPDEAKGEAPWEENDEVLYAKEAKITIMRERELLNYLGERQ
ncbi:MAG: hypothetical protein FJ290_11015 [Planctomycetes bacterium]|nr:hypothetical protein [Planctomycetota bacterium]